MATAMIEAVASPIDPIPRVVHGFDGHTPTEEQISTIGEVVVTVQEVSLEPRLLQSQKIVQALLLAEVEQNAHAQFPKNCWCTAQTSHFFGPGCAGIKRTFYS